MIRSHLHQHSFKQFQRFENIIAEVLGNRPAGTVIDPAPLKVTTYVARFRDAINGKILNDWPSSHFTNADLEETFACVDKGGQFVITSDDKGQVIVAPKFHVALKGAVQKTEVQLEVANGALDASDAEVFAALVLLKNRDIITSPVALSNVSQSQQLYLDSLLNIETIQQGNKTILL